MAQKFLVPLTLVSETTDPVSSSAGTMYYNSSEAQVKFYTGTQWIGLGRATAMLENEPEEPIDGTLWFDTTTNSLLVWSTDTWVNVSGASGNVNNPVDLSSSWWLGA